MINKDELRGKLKWLGDACERALKLHLSPKELTGKLPRSKPESGNPAFRDGTGAGEG